MSESKDNVVVAVAKLTAFAFLIVLAARLVVWFAEVLF